jgi:hypothetical protein
MGWPPIGVFIGVAAVVGVIIPLFRDPTKISKWEKSGYALIFFVLLGFEIKNDYRDRDEHDKRDQDFVTHQKEGFQESLDKSDKILSAAQETINEVTGGDSFCYVYLHVIKVNKEHLTEMALKAEGKYPLHGLEINQTDKGAVPGNSNVNLVTQIPYIPLLAKQAVRPLTSANVFGKKLQLYRFNFRSLNGEWTEDLAIYSKNGLDSFASALRVYEGERLLKEHAYPGFPSVQGHVDWHCLEMFVGMPQLVDSPPENCSADSK